MSTATERIRARRDRLRACGACITCGNAKARPNADTCENCNEKARRAVMEGRFTDFKTETFLPLVEKVRERYPEVEVHNGFTIAVGPISILTDPGKRVIQFSPCIPEFIMPGQNYVSRGSVLDINLASLEDMAEAVCELIVNMKNSVEYQMLMRS